MGFSLKKAAGGAIGAAKSVVKNPVGAAVLGPTGALAKIGLGGLKGSGILGQSAADKNAGLMASFDAIGGPRPEDFQYKSYLEEGKLPADMQAKLQYESGAIEAMRKRALTEGPSEWQNLALKQQGIEQQQALGQAQRGAATGLAQARSQLAMRGGLGGGAAERLAGMGSKNLLAQQQSVFGQGRLARAGLNLQDEQMRQQALSGLVGQEAQLSQLKAQPEQFNIQQRIAALDKEQAAKLEAYRTKMGGWAAGQQAKATLASAPQPGLLTQATGGILGGIF